MADKASKLKAFRTDLLTTMIMTHTNIKTGFPPEGGHCLMSMFYFSSSETDPLKATPR